MLVIIALFGAAYLVGFGLVGLSIYNKKRWHHAINQAGKLRTIGTVVGFDEENIPVEGKLTTVYHLIMRYRTMSDSVITAISQNPITKPSDYTIGETMTIYYSNRNPNQFFIYENHKRQRQNIVLLFAGSVLCVLTTLVLLIVTIICL